MTQEKKKKQKNALNGTILSIDDGNSIDLSVLKDGTGTDSQTLTLDSTLLNIEGGNSVDLSALISDQQNQIAALKTQLEDLAIAVKVLEDTLTELLSSSNRSITGIDQNHSNPAISGISQNYPKPTNGITVIDYFIVEKNANAFIMVTNLNGKEMSRHNIQHNGVGSYEFHKGGFADGIYLYTLIVNGSIIDTKRMAIL